MMAATDVCRGQAPSIEEPLLKVCTQATIINAARPERNYQWARKGLENGLENFILGALPHRNALDFMRSYQQLGFPRFMGRAAFE